MNDEIKETIDALVNETKWNDIVSDFDQDFLMVHWTNNGNPPIE